MQRYILWPQAPMRSASGIIVVLFLLVSIIGTLTAPVVQAKEEAEVDIVLTAVPGIHVARGGILAYKMRIENRGDSTMDYALAYLAYDPAKITPVDTQFDHGGDFVKKIEQNEVIVRFDEVGQDAARFAVIFFRVADNLPDGTVIDMTVDYDWEDQDGNYDLDERSNYAPVIVNSYNEDSPYVWSLVDPVQAPAGTEFGLYTDRFVPQERVRPWLRYPDGSEHKQDDRYAQTVAPDGRLWSRVNTDGLAPGTYQIILRGEDSDLEAINTIFIR
jgi:hypothetical protein